MNLLKELFGEPGKKIVVTKGLCAPSRNTVTGMFKQYGIKILDYEEHIEQILHNGKYIPVYYQATIKVRPQQAVWAEYVLLRSKKFLLKSKPLDKRNFAWANKYNGVMPPSWNKPIIDKGCKEAKQFRV